MRRYLILFLVFLLPLQISWAAVANYCAHEQEVGTHHLGHHQDEHQASADDANSDKQPTGNAGMGHDHNHLSGFVALLLTKSAIADPAPSSLRLPGDIKALPSLPPGRLDRPKWSAPA